MNQEMKNQKISIYVLSLKFGGAERAITSIANILVKENNVIIYSIYNYEPFYKLDKNIKLEYLTNLKPNKEIFLSSLHKFNVIKVIKEGFKAIKILYLKRKVLISSLIKDSSNIIITTRKEHNYYLAKYKNNCIKIGQEHNDFIDSKDIKKVIKGAKNLDYFMPASAFLKNKYEKLLKDYKVKVKYIAHPIEKYNKGNVKKENQIIAVGRLEKVKAFEDTIKVFDIISKKNPDLKLKIIGSGSEENYLKSINSNKNIIFTGHMNHEKLMKEYAKSKLLISTSKSESFGLVALESANAGTPTVAFSCANGLKEIIKNKENGLIIDNRNINKMAKEISNLLKDEKLLKLYSQNAKKTCDKYYEDVIFKKWQNFFKNQE